MEKSNAQITFFVNGSKSFKAVHWNTQAINHNVVSDTLLFGLNYWFACSVTQSFMLTDFGIQCAYGRTIIHGHTFGTTEIVSNTSAQVIED